MSTTPLPEHVRRKWAAFAERAEQTALADTRRAGELIKEASSKGSPAESIKLLQEAEYLLWRSKTAVSYYQDRQQLLGVWCDRPSRL
jgi:hypothetical protein